MAMRLLRYRITPRSSKAIEGVLKRTGQSRSDLIRGILGEHLANTNRIIEARAKSDIRVLQRIETGVIEMNLVAKLPTKDPKYIQTNVYVDPLLVKKLELIADLMGISRDKLVTLILDNYLYDHDAFERGKT